MSRADPTTEAHRRAHAHGQSLRLPEADAGDRIDRDKPIEFEFDSHIYQGFAGDTVASALAANGQFVLSRSFKYHRPRGALTFAGQDGNTLVQVPGNPNALADCVSIYPGLKVKPVNVFGSLMRDRARFLGLFSRFLPVGFYYKAFYRPKGAWNYWSKWFRLLTGLGELETDYSAERHDKRYRFFDVVVVGGGVAGLSAAYTAAEAGCDVLVVEDQPSLGGALHYERQHLTDAEQTRFNELCARVERHPAITVMTDSVCNGWFADHWLGVISQRCLHKVRASEVVLATGALEQPAVFRNNDLPGVMLSSGIQRLIRHYGVRPGRRAVVVTSNQNGYAAALDMLEAGVEVCAVADLNPDCADSERADMLKSRGVTVHLNVGIKEAVARGGLHLTSVVLTSSNDASNGASNGASKVVKYDVDVLCLAVGFMPAYQLACQAGARLDYTDETARFNLVKLPEGMHTAGAINGWFDFGHAASDGARAGLKAATSLGYAPANNMQSENMPMSVEPSRNASWPITPHPDGKEFVDLDEDLQVDDLVEATQDGYVDIQLVKRYSTCGMGLSQGRQSALAAARVVAKANGQSVAETGVTTARPPFAAERLAHSAGRSYFPRRLTSLHQEHVNAQATMMQAGSWERPAFYGSIETQQEAIQKEVLAVRQQVGMIDVSTLGGLDIRGPDAAEFMNRLYTGGFLKQPVGRARYALMADQAGVVIDDGVACRLGQEYFYVTATTAGVDRVYRAMLKWNAQWRLNVDVANVTSAYSAINLAGPRAREVLQVVCDDIDLSADAFGYMAVRTGHVTGMPARVLRVGFVGELGFEIHVPTGFARTLWQSLAEAGEPHGLIPFGVEAQRVMRLEKGHVIIGQDTDAMSNVHELQMGWAINQTKPFFVGKRTLQELEQRGIRRRLVGFTLDQSARALPKENQLVLNGDRMIGRVTSCALSPTLGYGVGLAYVPYDYTHPELCLKCDGGVRVTGTIVTGPFYDPDNLRQSL